MPGRFALGQRRVEEGLRMDEHPLVRFAEGPTAVRHCWELARTSGKSSPPSATTAAASPRRRYLRMPLGLVQAAGTPFGSGHSIMAEVTAPATYEAP